MTMRERSDLFELFIAFPAAAATSVLRVRRQNIRLNVKSITIFHPL